MRDPLMSVVINYNLCRAWICTRLPDTPIAPNRYLGSAVMKLQEKEIMPSERTVDDLWRRHRRPDSGAQVYAERTPISDWTTSERSWRLCC